jgi:hypothetical protein
VPVYFISEALSGVKKFYSELEEMIYAVVGGKKAEALLPELLNHYPNIISSSRNTREYGIFGINKKMGNRAIPIRHRVHSQDYHQVSSFRKLHCRLDTKSR